MVHWDLVLSVTTITGTFFFTSAAAMAAPKSTCFTVPPLASRIPRVLRLGKRYERLVNGLMELLWLVPSSNLSLLVRCVYKDGVFSAGVDLHVLSLHEKPQRAAKDSNHPGLAVAVVSLDVIGCSFD